MGAEGSIVQRACDAQDMVILDQIAEFLGPNPFARVAEAWAEEWGTAGVICPSLAQITAPVKSRDWDAGDPNVETTSR